MADIVEFPGMAAVAVAFLRGEFATSGETARVSTKVPNPMPPRMVRIDIGGSSERNRVTGSVLVIVQAYAASEPEAERLCERARALLRSTPELDSVPGASIMACLGSSLPVPLPDPDVATPRYQATVQLAVSP
ncbi:hypothetical protein ACFWQG_13055 [Rhodococcus sp. NPDC058532]|uniref:hypothetical protein n=1 Tax=Rhodococcus sp. NPDC058532 TaxID=3346540 RepID=UPI00364CC84B